MFTSCFYFVLAGTVNHSSETPNRTASPVTLKDTMTAKMETDSGATTTVAERNGTATSTETEQPLNMTGSIKTEDRGHPERKRRLSNESLDVSDFCEI